MKMTNEEYRRYAERRAPRSETGGNMLRAFLYGGAICCLGQGLIALYTALGLD
jgi:stage V sporulation protein AC